MVSKEIETYVEQLLRKAYGPKKMKKYSKKVNNIRKKKKNNKKKALHSQFKYVDKIIQHNMRKQGKVAQSRYTRKRMQKLKQMSPNAVRKVYRNTANTHDPYGHVNEMYQAIQALDFIEKQKRELEKYE